jgi:dTDP-glucose 4,6-dehydratase
MVSVEESPLKEIAIIGVNSFSGASLAKNLSESGIRVLGFCRTESTDSIYLPYKSETNKHSHLIEVINANLVSDHRIIAEKILNSGIRHVVNFASQSMVAESWNSPEDWYDTNLTSLAKLLKPFADNPRSLDKFIQFTTPEVYGTTSELLSENWNFNPSTPYAISRAASDFHLRCLYSEYGFPVIFTRAANVYGKHQKLYRVIPKFIIKAIKGESFELHGGGISTRSFIHIEDVSRALRAILSAGKIGHTYHISTNRFISINDLSRLILDHVSATNSNLLAASPDRRGKDLAYHLDSKKIRQELGWTETISLEEGIADVHSWIRGSWDRIQHAEIEYRHAR